MKISFSESTFPQITQKIPSHGMFYLHELIIVILSLLKCSVWGRHSPMSEVVVQRCSVKKVFLEILQNSQENTYARVSFLVKLQARPGLWLWVLSVLSFVSFLRFCFEFCELWAGKDCKFPLRWKALLSYAQWKRTIITYIIFILRWLLV